MKKETVYYVEFWAPGCFVGESWTVDVNDSDPENVEWPDEAYAFCMYKREDVIDGKKKFKGDSKQIGPMYYHPDSKIENLEEVSRNPKATSTLIGNMKSNKWSHLIWSRWGNWPQPFDPKKTKILTKSKKN